MCPLFSEDFDNTFSTAWFQKKKKSLLHLAVENGHLEVVRHLLQLKCEPNCADTVRCSVFLLACCLSCVAEAGAVEKVCNSRAANRPLQLSLDISQDAKSPLFYAVEREELDIADLLCSLDSIEADHPFEMVPRDCVGGEG